MSRQLLYQFDAMHDTDGEVIVRFDFVLEGVRMQFNLPPAAAAEIQETIGKAVAFTKRMMPLQPNAIPPAKMQ